MTNMLRCNFDAYLNSGDCNSASDLVGTRDLHLHRESVALGDPKFINNHQHDCSAKVPFVNGAWSLTFFEGLSFPYSSKVCITELKRLFYLAAQHCNYTCNGDLPFDIRQAADLQFDKHDDLISSLCFETIVEALKAFPLKSTALCEENQAIEQHPPAPSFSSSRHDQENTHVQGMGPFVNSC